MKYFIRVLGWMILSAAFVTAVPNAEAAQIRNQAEPKYKVSVADSPVNLGDAEKQKVLNFVESTYLKLPELIRAHLAPNRYPVTLRFAKLDRNTLIPMPECPAVEDMEPAAKIRDSFREIAKNFGSNKIRYDGAIHTAVTWNKDTSEYVVSIHSGFIPLILAADSGVMAKTCNNMTLPQIAEAAIVHGFVRAYDLTRFNSKAEADYVADPRACGSLKDNQGSDNDRMFWDEAHLECYDLQHSQTVVSEKKRYRVLSGGWSGKPGSYDKSNFAVWPRAVNPYTFAGDVQTHFAYHMERFILDPDFACRMPVMHEFLAGKFGEPYNSISTGRCRVNTILRLTPIISQENGNRVVALEEYDLDPKNVETIYYLRAGAGDEGIGSAFGHSMFRIVAKPNSNFARGGCEDEKYGMNCDLVFNHRATSRELRMDNGRAAFGGYPSQLLVGSVYDILQEYGDSELRDVYNIPLGNMVNKKFVPMADHDKERLLYAGIEQYWSYLGRYKFISNNCADEAMRLFSMSSTKTGVQYAGVLTPADISEKVFEKLGLTDPKFMKGLKESGIFSRILRKVAFWDGWIGGPQKRFEKRRKAVEANEWVEKSRRYDLYDGISDLFEIENKNLPKDRQIKTNDVNRIKKELNRWVQLATVSEKKEDICKINAERATDAAKLNMASERIQVFRDMYKRLMDPLEQKYAKTKDQAVWQDMYKLNHTFYLALYYADKKRQKAIGEMAVKIAYEIGSPDEKRPMLCDGDYKWEVPADRARAIHDRVEDYRKLEMQLQPYSSFSVMRGYGIPLEKELTQGYVYTAVANAQLQRQQELIVLLRGELGVDYETWFRIKQFRKDLCEERVNKALVENGETPNCRIIFPDVYTAEAELQKAAAAKNKAK